MKKGGEPKRKEGEVETNLAAGAMGHRRGKEEEGQVMLDPAATECDGPQKNWKKVKQSKNSAQIRLFDLADSYPKSSVLLELVP